MDDSRKDSHEQRTEERFSCAGTVLLYAPAEVERNESVAEMRTAPLQDMSLSGLSFDISAPMEIGRKLVLVIQHAGESKQERLTAEVRWCKLVGIGAYRVGVRIESSELGVACDAVSSPAEDNSDCIVGVLTTYRQVMLGGR